MNERRAAAASNQPQLIPCSALQTRKLSHTQQASGLTSIGSDVLGAGGAAKRVQTRHTQLDSHSTDSGRFVLSRLEQPCPPSQASRYSQALLLQPVPPAWVLLSSSSLVALAPCFW